MATASRREHTTKNTRNDGAFDVIPFPIYVVDALTLELVSVNQAMRRKTGAEAGQTCHKAIYDQPSPCHFCKIGPLSEAAAHGPAAMVFEHFNDRDDCWYQLNETLMEWFDGRRVKHSIAVDIGALKDAQNELSEAYALLALKSVELEKASITDTLTGLFNRRRLDEAYAHELDRAQRYAKPVSLIIGDVDHFKAINDTHGHQTGDDVLKSIAELLRSGVRAVDIVGRWGGEEFLVICPDTDLDGAQALAEKLRSSIAAEPFPAIGPTTSSFGVAQYRAGESFKDTVARADTALYKAKINGRNRVES
ncbi:putative Response regulator [Magnetospirillum sp. XM-1]|uniref:GGDEF domain-containing protein n=1 Tax=Magnetospirillum sp. XM-1 TaxID=1663591 RepID=UPI00073DD775|nr:GGDEF domain-containing protein [Magnetospirillum sp. XM-1]CUW39716.1 putative Response regulator [Magnetospirillum sp. XM-1]